MSGREQKASKARRTSSATVSLPIPVPEKARTRRKGRPVGKSRVLPGDTVGAFCWCGRIEVPVPIEDVTNGRTGSCGRPKCVPPTDRGGRP